MMLALLIMLLGLCVVFGGMLFGFMLLMDRLKKREEARKDREAGFK